jgi:RNA polymerase sigma factor (sigma-70 family)
MNRFIFIRGAKGEGGCHGRPAMDPSILSNVAVQVVTPAERLADAHQQFLEANQPYANLLNVSQPELMVSRVMRLAETAAGFSSYEKMVRSLPMLEAIEERAALHLAKLHPDPRIAAGARSVLLLHHQKLVLSYATQMCRKYAHLNLNQEDLIAPGMEGLSEGIDQFDLNQNFRFMTYAKTKVRMRINRAVEGASGLTQRQFYDLGRISHAFSELGYERFDSVDFEKLFEKVVEINRTGDTLTRDRVEFALNRYQAGSDTSLQKAVRGSEEGEETRFGDLLVDPGPSTESRVETLEQARSIYGAFGELPPAQQQVIGRLYGLAGFDAAESVTNVASELGLSVGQVQRLRDKGLRLLRYHEGLRKQVLEGEDARSAELDELSELMSE